LATRLNLRAIEEYCGIANDGAAEFLETFLAVMRCNRINDVADMGVGLGEVDYWLIWLHTHRPAGTVRLRRLASSEQSLGWHAAIVEAIPAHLAFFDENHRSAHLSGTGRNGQAARASTDDAEVRFQNCTVIGGGHGIVSR